MSAAPKLHELACVLYDALEAKAHRNDALGTLEFEGSMVKVYGSTGLSRSHYSKLFSVLIEIGSIDIAQRGARMTPTVMRLLGRPTLEQIEHAEEIAKPHLTKREPSAMVQLQQRVTQLERRLQGIDVTEAIINLDQRLKRLETGEQ